MLSKSFCSKDIRKKNHIKQMLSSFLIEQSFPAYNNIKTFNAPIDNTISKQIEKDLNRKLNLFIQDASSNTKSINVVDNMRKTSTEPIPSSDLCTHLQETYGLSLGQANYIVISSTQGGIGGCYPSDLINNINPDITYMVNRKTLLSQIIIHQNKNVEYIGGQVILFDVSIKDYEQALLQGNGIENYLMNCSNDKVVLYVSVNLGTIGQNFTTHPEVHIHVGVVGKYGAEFLAELNTAKTRCKELKNITYDEIEINYLAFSEDTLYNNTQRAQRYNSLVYNKQWHKEELYAYTTDDSDDNLDTKSETNFSIVTQCMPSNPSSLDQEDFDHFINAKHGNISLENIAWDTKNEASNTKPSTSIISSLLNKLKLPLDSNKKFLDGKQSTFYVDVDSNNDQRQIRHNHDVLDSLKQLLLIIKGITSYTATSNDIKQLQSIFINYHNNKIKDEFISKLSTELDNKQLHTLNCLIMQTMNALLPDEDTSCLLRRDEDKIWHKLLLSEAERCGMTIKLPNSMDQVLTIPEIPQKICELYNILKDTFYNQHNRQSPQTLEQKVAESIHWLFINPLILKNNNLEHMDFGLQKKLLQYSGEYTQLLRGSNILSKNILPVVDSSVLLLSESTKQLNNIMEVFRADIIDILINTLKENATKKLNMVIRQNMITDVIQPELDTKTVWDLLYNNQNIINDRISLLCTDYSQDPLAITTKLLALHTYNNANTTITNQQDLVIKPDISEQVTCNSDNKHTIQKYTKLYVTSFLPLVYEYKDLLVHDNNQDQEEINLVGTLGCLITEVYL